MSGREHKKKVTRARGGAAAGPLVPSARAHSRASIARRRRPFCPPFALRTAIPLPRAGTRHPSLPLFAGKRHPKPTPRPPFPPRSLPAVRPLSSPRTFGRCVLLLLARRQGDDVVGWLLLRAALRQLGRRAALLRLGGERGRAARAGQGEGEGEMHFFFEGQGRGGAGGGRFRSASGVSRRRGDLTGARSSAGGGGPEECVWRAGRHKRGERPV